MNNESLSASDVLALAGNKQDGFGGVGRFYPIVYIFNSFRWRRLWIW